MGEFVEEEQREMVVFFEVENCFLGAEEELFAFFEDEVGIGGFNGVEKSKVFRGKGFGGRGGRSRREVANVIGEN